MPKLWDLISEKAAELVDSHDEADMVKSDQVLKKGFESYIKSICRDPEGYMQVHQSMTEAFVDDEVAKQFFRYMAVQTDPTHRKQYITMLLLFMSIGHAILLGRKPDNLLGDGTVDDEEFNLLRIQQRKGDS